MKAPQVCSLVDTWAQAQPLLLAKVERCLPRQEGTGPEEPNIFALNESADKVDLIRTKAYQQRSIAVQPHRGSHAADLLRHGAHH